MSRKRTSFWAVLAAVSLAALSLGVGGPRLAAQGATPSLAKSASPSTARVGELIAFIITLTNPTAAPIAGEVVTDTLPSSVTFSSATATPAGATACTHSAGVVTCPLGTIPAGGTGTVTILARATQVGSFTNTAAALGTEPASARFSVVAAEAEPPTQVGGITQGAVGDIPFTGAAEAVVAQPSFTG